MKNFFIYTLCFSPLIIYNVYMLFTKEPNSGIDTIQIGISGILGIAGYVISQKVSNR